MSIKMLLFVSVYHFLFLSAYKSADIHRTGIGFLLISTWKFSISFKNRRRSDRIKNIILKAAGMDGSFQGSRGGVNQMPIVQYLPTLELLFFNLFTIDRCCHRKYRFFKTFLTLFLFSAVLFGFSYTPLRRNFPFGETEASVCAALFF